MGQSAEEWTDAAAAKNPNIRGNSFPLFGCPPPKTIFLAFIFFRFCVCVFFFIFSAISSSSDNRKLFKEQKRWMHEIIGSQQRFFSVYFSVNLTNLITTTTFSITIKQRTHTHSHSSSFALFLCLSAVPCRHESRQCQQIEHRTQ